MREKRPDQLQLHCCCQSISSHLFLSIQVTWFLVWAQSSARTPGLGIVFRNLAASNGQIDHILLCLHQSPQGIAWDKDGLAIPPSAPTPGSSGALSPCLALPQAPCSLQGIGTGLSYGLIFFILLFPLLPSTFFFIFFFLSRSFKNFWFFSLCVCVKPLKARKLKPMGPPGRICMGWEMCVALVCPSSECGNPFRAYIPSQSTCPLVLMLPSLDPVSLWPLPAWSPCVNL